jgi:hypothetical protein
VKKSVLIASVMLLGLVIFLIPNIAFSGDKEGGCPMAKMAAGCPSKADAAKCGTDKCAYLTLKVAGLKDAESGLKLTDALKAEKGVMKADSLDFKTEQAVICYNPSVIKADKLVSLAQGAGYKVEIIPEAAGCMKKGTTCDVMTGKCGGAKDTKPADGKDSH